MDQSKFVFNSDTPIDKIVFRAEGEAPAWSHTIPNPLGYKLRLWVLWRPKGAATWTSGQNFYFDGTNTPPSMASISCTDQEIGLSITSADSSDIFEYKIVGAKL